MAFLDALLRSSRFPVAPYQGTISLASSRAAQRREQERANRASEGLRRRGLGLQEEQLGLQRRAQDLGQERFDTTLQERRDVRSSKERAAAFKSLMGNVMRQNRAGIETDRANLERLGFSLEGGAQRRPAQLRGMPRLSAEETELATPVKLVGRSAQLEERLPAKKTGGYRVVDRNTGEEAWEIDESERSSSQP